MAETPRKHERYFLGGISRLKATTGERERAISNSPHARTEYAHAPWHFERISCGRARARVATLTSQSFCEVFARLNDLHLSALLENNLRAHRFIIHAQRKSATG